MKKSKLYTILHHFLLSSLTLSFVILMLYVSLVPIALDRNFFHEQFVQNNSAERANLSRDTIEVVIDHVLDYLWGEEESMQISITTLDDETINAFSQREIDHMVDVKVLFLNGRSIAFYLLIYSIACIIVLGLQWKKAKPSWLRTPLITFACFLGTVAIIGGLAALDFNQAFTLFHHIFFRNDLWLLDYDDLLIIMLPESLFATIVWNTILRFMLQIILAMLLLFFGYRYSKRHYLVSDQ